MNLNINKISLQAIIAVISVIFSFALMFLIVFVTIPEENKDLFNIMFGINVGTSITSVFGWLYTQAKPPVKS